MRSPAKTCCLVMTILTLAACRDSSVASYRIPKEKDAPAPAHDHASAPAGVAGGGMSDMPVAGADAGSLTWTAPSGWQAKQASAMRKGSYTVGAEAGATADVSITAFPGDVGGEAANVNRWRGQVGLAEIPDTDVPAAISRLKVDSLEIGYIDLVNGPQRMLAAFVPFQGSTWFFKLTGPDAIVAGAKPAYLDFLRSIRPGTAAPAAPAATPAPAPAAPPADMASTPVTRAEGPALKWTAPAQWEARALTPARKGSYTVKGPGDTAGDVSVTAFPGDVGGELGNVNRWRGQLQLPPLTAAQLDGAVVRRQQGSLQVTIVDLTGGDAAQPARMIGAIVPFNGATWFFKLTGPAELVAREERAFLDFINTVQAP